MKRILALIAVLCALLGCFAGCDNQDATPDTDAPDATTPDATTPSATEPGTTQQEWVDYAGSLTLDLNSETVKEKVTVKAFVDGDTTHFNASTSFSAGGLLKARYLAVNTPESTGKIEEYGKAASNFTRQRLENAAEILVESEDGNWNADSTGDRYLVWVWYKNPDSATWRTLNVELLDPKAENYPQRQRRFRFYGRNGFFDTGYHVWEVGGEFRVLSTGLPLDVPRYKQVFRKLTFGLWDVRLEKA